jgi:hypothetical protein
VSDSIILVDLIDTWCRSSIQNNSAFTGWILALGSHHLAIREVASIPILQVRKWEHKQSKIPGVSSKNHI